MKKTRKNKKHKKNTRKYKKSKTRGGTVHISEEDERGFNYANQLLIKLNLDLHKCSKKLKETEKLLRGLQTQVRPIQMGVPVIGTDHSHSYRDALVYEPNEEPNDYLYERLQRLSYRNQD